MTRRPDHEDRLDRFCRLLYEATLLPLIRMDQAGLIQSCRPDSFPVNPRYSSLQEQVEGWIGERSPAAIPMLHSTPFLENFLLVSTGEEAEFACGWILVGPVVSAAWPEELLTGLLQDLKVPQRQRPGWIAYYRNLPVIDKSRLLYAGLLVHEWLTGQSLDPDDLIDASEPVDERSAMKPAVLASLRLSGTREAGVYHHSPDTERLFLKHIQHGNKKELLRAFTTLADQGVGILSRRSPLRHQKNIAITVITLATRAAMEGGMFPEEAYTLSDMHIQHIEELGEVSKVESALQAALGDFADGVKRGLDQRVSRPIAVCQRYIFDHLYEELSLPVLAKISGVSTVHLSRLFRRETGISLTEYIQRQRVEEAKQLLSLSDYSLSDISARLLFHDQSYFTKVFKKYAGVTPKQYRHRRLGTAASGK
ncbi:helix-turn-helix domain-containing protein [Paenibacillus macerans]|uniref:helix-turn-helix domain-containing protein n=1 Tax=Paenibacillus macerans TaxID=44252 RepID=UPI002040F7C1|nr:helix-turn-helix domain-containing protein [Paenibacillus macerans]MCM3699529.1 helix-turn-helix domain-containing protein [Paenibacillus macerans]